MSDHLRALEAEATPGEWEAEPDGNCEDCGGCWCVVVPDTADPDGFCYLARHLSTDDAELIVAARNALLADHAAMKASLERIVALGGGNPEADHDCDIYVPPFTCATEKPWVWCAPCLARIARQTLTNLEA